MDWEWVGWVLSRDWWNGVEALATVVATVAGIVTVVLTASGRISFVPASDADIDALFDEPSDADPVEEPVEGAGRDSGFRVRLADLLVRLADRIRP